MATAKTIPASKRGACSSCGKAVWRSSTSADHQVCRDCRQAAPTEHGARTAYRSGCRCDPCCTWQRDENRRQVARRRELDAARERCSEPECSRPVRTRGLCKMHYKTWARANGMERPPSDAWSETRASNYHRRRARLAGGRNADRVLLSQVIERDGLACRGCGQPVDMSTPWPDRLSKSIDHIVPISRGGEHTLANAALMHLGCNSSKGARITSATFEHTHGETPRGVTQ